MNAVVSKLPESHPARLPARLFLTGGSGYVGRNLIRHFVSQGVEVIALARSPAAQDTIRASGANPFEGDLLSENLATGMAGCDALIHAAADTDHGLSTDAQFQTNVIGTRHVFAAAARAGVRRAVHLSTESVLLDGSPLVDAEESRSIPTRPVGGYSATKALAEREAIAAAQHGLDVVIVRPRFIWGRDDTTALPQLLQAVDAGKFAWIDGGRYRTSTTHIGNLVHGIERALIAGETGACYFITDDDIVEFRAFISALLQSQGRSVPTKEIPGWVIRAMASVCERLSSLTGGRWRPPVTRQALAPSAVEVTLNIDKARRELGYQPQISRAQGLEELTLEDRGEKGQLTRSKLT
ncbi:3 beta-hydroxysteroid dehydrogenase/Delta 5--_4-isomerase|jgi:nucleoside-diphosphate-sugar epimerase|uniref:NAD-dependent epimerase/dehydratase family protein n=1 Tax=Delftia acidovorans TaxID=80866 RepID=UPI001C0AB6AB|nr:NAD-dependent epimerase/dehydratase family protein [Delftia acidovorans]MCA1071723.1 3 beta-hydroxysteroid dehydrogenase/Delta 5-->4-isomerase [Delftia acidovorans]